MSEMTRRAYIMGMVIAAGCAGLPPGSVGEPTPLTDAGSDDAELAAIDAGGDAPAEMPPVPPPWLAELCGAIPTSLEDWERCYKKRWCDVQVGCVPLNRYRDVQECLERSDDVEGGWLDAELRARARAVGQARPSASINIPAFTQCLIDTSAEHCNTVWSSVACATRFTGTIADGGPCLTDVECASPGATCELSCAEACCPGTCRPRFREGEACDLFESCEPGLMCHRTCLSGDIGALCENDRDCDSNGWCDAGRCRADLAPGAACTNLLQCGGQTSCFGLSIIDADPGQCLSIAKAGDRCDFICYGNLYCDGSGICRDLPEHGQPCSGLAPCRGVDMVCRNGVCAQRDGVGTSCSDNRTCQPGLFCTSELNAPAPACVVRGAVGEPCAAPSHCDSYLCSGGTSRPGVCLSASDSCPLGGADAN